MSREKFEKSIKKPLGIILFWTVCILLIVAALTAVAVTYARYIVSDNYGNSSKVANVGVDKFELKEHKAVTDDVDEMVKQNVLHILDMDTEIAGDSKQTYLVPPGVDIPKDPFIRLTIDSEVSYELYLKVSCKEFPPVDDNTDISKQLVLYYLTDSWELTETDAANGVYTYKYVVSPNEDGAKKYVFTAGQSYTYDNGNEIGILKGDMIYVSENYYVNDSNTKESLSFSIKFDAYVQQVVSAA